jgi:hypothetical protein
MPETPKPTDRLTHEQMVQLIRSGKAIMINGRVITDEADLPSEADWAAGDPGSEDAVLDKLKSQQAELDRQVTSLEKSKAKNKADGGKK